MLEELNDRTDSVNRRRCCPGGVGLGNMGQGISSYQQEGGCEGGKLTHSISPAVLALVAKIIASGR